MALMHWHNPEYVEFLILHYNNHCAYTCTMCFYIVRLHAHMIIGVQHTPITGISVISFSLIFRFQFPLREIHAIYTYRMHFPSVNYSIHECFNHAWS